MRMNKKAAFAGAVLSGILLSSGASAMTTLTAGNVSYTFEEAELGLFGTASLVGDSLALTPTNFLATSSASAVQTVHITITADAGYNLTALNLSENGGYTMPSLADQVILAGNIGVLDIEGDTSNHLYSNIQTLAPLSGTGGNWTAQAGVVVPARGWGGSDGILSSVNFTINNQLFALGAGEIWKNAVTVAAVTTPVPEAETYAMMLVGLGLIGFLVRRRMRLLA